MEETGGRGRMTQEAKEIRKEIVKTAREEKEGWKIRRKGLEGREAKK